MSYEDVLLFVKDPNLNSIIGLNALLVGYLLFQLIVKNKNINSIEILLESFAFGIPISIIEMLIFGNFWDIGTGFLVSIFLVSVLILYYRIRHRKITLKS